MPIPDCFFSQHLAPSSLQGPQPSQQHPDAPQAMAVAITTIIELTFMDYLSFFFSLSHRTHFRFDGEMIHLFLSQFNYNLFNFVVIPTKNIFLSTSTLTKLFSLFYFIVDNLSITVNIIQ
jgi:hypothetical protein